MSTRRTFLLGTLATGSAMALLPGCVDEAAGADRRGDDPGALPRADVADGDDLAAWQRLARQRVKHANAHDLTALMSSYSSDAELVLNGVRLTGSAIRPQLEQLGLGGSGGGLADVRLLTDAEFFTEDEILHRGRLTGKHVAPLFGFPPLARDVALHFAVFRRFTRDERLVSERLTLNLGVLNPSLVLLNG